MSEYRNMTDQELHEQYITLKVALKEYGYTENLVNAYISCTTEIACRYFDEKGIYDRKAREELVKRMIKHE